MEVLWIRHGESLGNVEKRIQTEEEPLTEEGILQAARLKKRFEGVSIDQVFCSPMVRCKETAKIIFGDTNTPIEFVKEIEEKRNGIMEGKKLEEADWTEINKAPFEERKAPQGESLRDVAKRAQSFLDRLKHLKDNRVCIISHSTILRVIIALTQDKPLEEAILTTKIDNAEIVKSTVTSNKIVFNF
ncbi:MAG TPA: histidine phosphatase family protein [Candidatus Nanoarchaeia archaeon]|nr:histidine phosphatase family protein [Candidatus Nanoarchaeia archaeon]